MAHRNPLIAVYPGTFDPMTLGHEDLMRRASGLFDKLLLAVAAGHHKRTMFTIGERIEIAREVAKPYANVEVVAFRGLLRDFVVENGGKVVVRGLRAVSDFEYEFQMALMNRQLFRQRHFRARDCDAGWRCVQVRGAFRAAPPAGSRYSHRGHLNCVRVVAWR